jgi:hypothetical protein
MMVLEAPVGKLLESSLSTFYCPQKTTQDNEKKYIKNFSFVIISPEFIPKENLSHTRRLRL